MNKSMLVAAAVGSALLPSGHAYALPTGETIIHGGVAVSRPAAQTMQIDQSTHKAIVNWQGFSIGSGEHVNISQPGTSSVLLNRVLGSNASEIFGRLTANGQVFLTNPNGVLFAPGASVEVGSLFASTLSMTDQDFLNGNYRASNAGGVGSVTNRGRIVTPNGYTALAGPQVRNEGVIIARLGAVALAAGNRVSLDMVGDGLINVSVDEAALNASLVNTGTLEANGGLVLLRARSASALLDTVINNTGTIRATRLEERNGQIVLDGGTNGIVGSTGTLEADTMVLDGAEIHITDAGSPGPLITPPGPVVGPAVFPTLDTRTPIPVTQTTQTGPITWGTFSISASETVQFIQPAGSISLASTHRVGATASTAPIYGSIMLNTGSIGRLAPLQHSIVGTGVTLPADGLLTLK